MSTDNVFTGINPSTIPISHLEFSVRTTNCFFNAGFKTIGDIVSKSEQELMKLPNFGRRSLNEVRAVLGTFNLSLREGPVLTLEQQMQSALIRARAAKHSYENAMADVRRVAQQMVESPITEVEL